MDSWEMPKLVTEVPGPEAQAVVSRCREAVTPSLPFAYPLAVIKARGMVVEDVDGNRFLDCAAGIAVCSTGHCHPRVVGAIQEQAARLIHICGADFYDPLYVTLAERLARLAPGNGEKKVFLGNSGAEAVEAAFKLARYHTGRSQVISFFGAFHGRTMGAVSLTGSSPAYKKDFRPLVSGVTHIPFGYCYRCGYNLTYPACDLACIGYIEDVLFARTIHPDEVAAVFVEPIQGEGGYIVPPPEWLPRLRALCDKHGILLVADEVQSGVGRTGKFFSVEHWGVEPDIVCVAKGIASGMPVSATIARGDVMDWPPGTHGSTFGGNPVACAAAMATIDVIEQEKLMENAVMVGDRLAANLRELAEESRLIGDVRGLGLMIGVEMVQDKATKARAKQEAREVTLECFRHGLLLLTCGPNSIRFAPPLIISQAQADVAFRIFAEALKGVEGRSR